MTISGFTLWISGEPKGQKRVRHHGQHHWTHPETKLAAAEIVRKWEDQGSPRLHDDAAIRMEVTLYVARPAGHYKKDGELSSEGQRNTRPFKKKPDLDNAIKLIMDAMNKRAYKDDVRIVEAVVERHWAEWPATKIKFIVINGSDST